MTRVAPTGSPAAGAARRGPNHPGPAVGHADHGGGDPAGAPSGPPRANGYTHLPMYAVVRSGGKQERVAQGDQLRVELLDAALDSEVELDAVLVVDGERVLATPAQLAGSMVTARVVGTELGPKIRGFTYKPKTNQRRRWGHRQRYTTLQITDITVPS